MANPLLGTIRDTQGLKDVRSDVESAFRFFDETLKVQEHSSIIKARDISGNSLIWGNASKAWGSPYEWAAVITNAFILGNSAAGILGASPLGSNLSGFTIYGVTNPNGVWKEALRTTTFKDTTNTTATWDTTNFRWSFTTGQIIQTSLISYNETVTIVNATLNIESSQITNPNNLTYFLSADDGSNFEQVTLGTQHVFTNTGKKLKLKIVASGTAQIDVDDSNDYSYPIEVKVNQ